MLDRVHRKLGHNHGAYHGERIDIDAVLGEIRALARMHGWFADDLNTESGPALLALRRAGASVDANARRRIYLSSGIHGDEPAGPLAVRQLLADNLWPADADLWLCPCLNPAGFQRNTRENAAGLDLNRDYRHRQSAEVHAHVAWLEHQTRFDFTLCLHEDWEAHGFYVYEMNPAQQSAVAARIIPAVAPICPIDSSLEIDGRPAQGGVILPAPEPAKRELWPEAVYLFAHHTAHACTLEAPSDFPLSVRVAALVAGTRAALGG